MGRELKKSKLDHFLVRDVIKRIGISLDTEGVESRPAAGSQPWTSVTIIQRFCCLFITICLLVCLHVYLFTYLLIYSQRRLSRLSTFSAISAELKWIGPPSEQDRECNIRGSLWFIVC